MLPSNKSDMQPLHCTLWLLVVLLCACYCGSWQGILINNELGTQIWSPFLDPHGVANVTFALPRYSWGRAARLSNGKAYFVGGEENSDGTTFIVDPVTNGTLPGAKLNTPCSKAGRNVSGSMHTVTASKLCLFPANCAINCVFHPHS